MFRFFWFKKLPQWHLNLLHFFDDAYVVFFYCCSSTIVSIFPPLLYPTPPTPPPTLNPTPLCLCPWVLYTCSLMTLPLLSPISPSPVPSGYCQFVLYFSVSDYILLACLFYWLGFTCRWDHMVLLLLKQNVECLWEIIKAHHRKVRRYKILKHL